MLLSLLLFVFGLCVGSFLNVVIDRLPKSENVVRGKSRCPGCGHDLAWHDLIPLLSFVILRGKCRYCQQKISWQYPLVELSTALLFASSLVLSSNFHLLNPSSVLYPLSSIFLIPIFVIDLKHGIIPDKLVFPAIALVTSYRLLITSYSLDFSPLFVTLLGSLVLYSSFFILHSVFRGRALGGGDVKLAFLVGLIAGWPNMIVAVFSAFLTGAAVGVILVVLEKKKFGETVPFGPFLVIGTYIALFWGRDIIDWYLSML